MGKTITKNVLHTGGLDTLFTSGRGRVLKVSAAEADGIRSILANPKRPTPELKAAWADYVCHAAENPDSNW